MPISQRDREPERGQVLRPTRADKTRFAGLPLSSFRRAYRWLNLTLIHQGLWPLLLILFSAPAGPVGATPQPWYWARLAGPALAAIIAAVYLRRRPVSGAAPPGAESSTGGEAMLRRQAALLLPGIAILLGLARLLVGPAEPVAKTLLFGVADVFAFQLIHFGVVARSWGGGETGQGAAVGLFAASWGLRDAFLALAGAGAPDWGLAFLISGGVGLAVGALSSVLRRWPGGFWPAFAAHYSLVYLVAGFV